MTITRKIRLGRTNMMVTELGLGGIPLPRVTEEQAIAIVHRCLDLGINFIDTATLYSTSEERIGKALSGRRREDVFLATKTQERTSEGIMNGLKQSLERLRTGYIDLYQFHNVSDFDSLDKILKPDGLLDFVRKLQKDGLVRHIGITSHQIDVARAAVKSDQFETMMFGFNFVTSEGGEEILPLARERDMGFIAMKPLAGGMLNNAALAFKYIFQYPDIVAIPGIEKIEEIEEIAALYSGPRVLTAKDKKEIEQMKRSVGDRFCRRCDYCRPCTVGIPISDVMNFPHLSRTLRTDRLFAEWVTGLITKAAECTECAVCEDRCPYHLPIREMIKKHVAYFEAEKKKYLAGGDQPSKPLTLY